MQSIDLIRENLRKSEDIVLARIEDMREHCLVPPTSRGGCHTLWILGHLAYIEGLIIRKFMLGEPHPLASWESMFDGDEVSRIADDFVSFDVALAECRAQRAATLKLADKFEEHHLDQASANVPQQAMELFGTYRKCLQYVCDHWYMHRGQLADTRRAAGLERMWY